MEYEKFEEKMIFDKIDSVKAVYAVGDTLRRIDARLMEHGDRVAYIADQLCKEGGFALDKKILHLLCVFHDIGAYETEEIDQMLEFETEHEHVQRHSIYGYLFLKYLTPLHNYAEAILYHHFSWSRLDEIHTPYKDYAAMIHLADRIDVVMNYKKDEEEIQSYLLQNRSLFKEKFYLVAEKCLKNNCILPAIKNGSYLEENRKACSSFILSAQEAFDYLKMIIYTIDFRSDHTVTHTINTVSISVNIALHFNMRDEKIEQIYIGALLHDIGKVAIPHEILESPGRLSEEDMVIMRTHVEETAILIKDIIPDEIYQIAIRHHEKLDGSGYPEGLMAEELSFSERIVAVADVLSALSSRRSYKDPFPKERTLAIISDMMKTQLDPEICQYVLDHYDLIMKETDESRKQVIEKYLHIRNEYGKYSESMLQFNCVQLNERQMKNEQ